MNNELVQLISIRFKEFIREPASLFWTFLFPILMAWGLGIAFSSSPDIERKVIVVQGDTIRKNPITDFLTLETKVIPATKYTGRHFEKIFENTTLGSTTFHFIPASWEEAITLIKKGNATIILTYDRKEISYHFDPANPEAQLIYMQLNAIFNDNEAFFTQTEMVKPLTRKGSRYIDFLVPGLMAMSIMSSCMWGISYTLIEQRSKKLLRRMIATPMKKSSFLLSHLISRIVITSLEVFTLALFAYGYFDIELQGSLLAFILLLLSGNVAFIGISTLISSRTANTQVGNGLINAFSMPMMIMSGIFFSYHNFPDWTIPIIQKLPLTIFADGIRSVFIEGVGLKELYSSISLLFGMGIVCFFCGLKIFKWY